MLLANKTNIIQSKKRRDFLRYQSWAIYIVYNISMKGQLINKLKLQMEHWNNYKWQITIKKGALNIVNYKCFFFHERAVVTNLPMEWLQITNYNGDIKYYKLQITNFKGTINSATMFFFHKRSVVTSLPMEWLQITNYKGDIKYYKLQITNFKRNHIIHVHVFLPRKVSDYQFTNGVITNYKLQRGHQILQKTAFSHWSRAGLL